MAKKIFGLVLKKIGIDQKYDKENFLVPYSNKKG
jgi:hypothetical protein